MRDVRTKAWIDDKLGSLTKFSSTDSSVNAILKTRKKELEEIRNNFQIKENAAYSKLKVENLKQLQEKIRTINGSGLNNLANEALNKFPITKDIGNLEYSEEEIRKGIENLVKRDSEIIDTEAIIDKIVALIKAKREIKVIGVDKKNKSNRLNEKQLRKNLEKYLSYSEGDKKHSKSKKSKQLGSYKSEIIDLLEIEKKTPESLEFKVYTQNLTNKNVTLDYYPYYVSSSLDSKKQIVENFSNSAVWESFVSKMCTICPKYDYEIRETMNSMRYEAFIVYSKSEVIGILGELQLLVIIRVLTGQKARYTGSWKNLLKNKAQVGVDVLFKGIGFQVKNYTIYESDTSSGINLSYDWTLEYFQSKIAEYFGPNELFNFYALKSFHVPIDTSFYGTANLFDTIENNLKAIYPGYVTNFLPFSELVKIDFGKTTSEFDMENLFWFIGGKYIVPSSRIIQAYISKIEAIIDNRTNRRGVSVNSTYDGATYKDYMGNLEKMPSLEEVGNKVYMKVVINLNLPDLISDILREAVSNE